MAESIDSTHYFELREQLKTLQSADVPDMASIDAVITALGKEQQRLKALDGQHGDNPIEWRHEDPPPGFQVERVESGDASVSDSAPSRADARLDN